MIILKENSYKPALLPEHSPGPRFYHITIYTYILSFPTLWRNYHYSMEKWETIYGKILKSWYFNVFMYVTLNQAHLGNKVFHSWTKRLDWSLIHGNSIHISLHLWNMKNINQNTTVFSPDTVHDIILPNAQVFGDTC